MNVFENINKLKMKIIGIDPAPGKNSTVFDGENFHSFT